VTAASTAAAGAVGQAAAAAGAAKAVGHNWSLLAPEVSVKQLLSEVPDAVQQLMLPHNQTEYSGDPAATPAVAEERAGEGRPHCSIPKSNPSSRRDADELVVLHTFGSARQQLEGLRYVFMLLPAIQHDAILEWLQVHCARTAGRGFSSMTGMSASIHCTQPCVLVHANEAAVPAAVLTQMANAAGWSTTQLKHMQAPSAPSSSKRADSTNCIACIGIELHCCDDAHVTELSASAAALGAACTSSEQAAILFRTLGVDG